MSGEPVPKVFGIGWAKTGTTTLGAALRALGFAHCSARLDLVVPATNGELEAVFDVVREFESFDDWPWPLLFAELDAAFANSRFILTTRDPARWLASYRNMVSRQPAPSPELTEVRRAIYGTNTEALNDDDLVDLVARHDAAVRAHFTGREHSLLVVDWERGHGWNELCEFLERAAPSLPFPHENRGAYGASRHDSRANDG